MINLVRMIYHVLANTTIWWNTYRQTSHVWVNPFGRMLVESLNLSELHVLEIGGGNSTRFWAERAKMVTCIESDVEWAKYIERSCSDLKNVKVHVVTKGDAEQSWIKNNLRLTEAGGIAIIDGGTRKLWFSELIKNPAYFLILLDDSSEYGVSLDFEQPEPVSFHLSGFKGGSWRKSTLSVFIKQNSA